MVRAISIIGGLLVFTGTIGSLFLGFLTWYTVEWASYGTINNMFEGISAFGPYVGTTPGGAMWQWTCVLGLCIESSNLYYAWVPAGVLSLPGILAVVGGILCIVGKKPAIAGGVMCIASVLIFIYFLVSFPHSIIAENPSLLWGGTGNFIHVGYGAIMTGAGGILGLVGARKPVKKQWKPY